MQEIAAVTSRWRDDALRAGVQEEAIEARAGAFEGPNLERARPR
ncbi:hypothetical protein GCM10009846_23490 [Agrococcus versicolor]|uniref:Uncharacterized protein n=1 Tax=Agrococcus versicolor TaxID=501482 RepID=A0ABN3AUS9_9MICO